MTLVAPGTLVLVVDDDAEVRQSVADLLILEGYDARPLASANAAWSELSLGASPALIILDLWLTGMSSGEFVRRLRASHHARTPVLVLSGSKSKDDIAADVDAVSQKPIEATTLVRVVDRLARKSAPSKENGRSGRRVRFGRKVSAPSGRRITNR
jgi:DNA-binding response OmpR family regulator